MFRNAFAYITRKWSKSLLLLIIILLMSTLSLLEQTLQNQSPERAKNFKSTLMLTGVNDS